MYALGEWSGREGSGRDYGRDDIRSVLRGANSVPSEWYVWFSPLIISLLGVGCLFLDNFSVTIFTSCAARVE